MLMVWLIGFNLHRFRGHRHVGIHAGRSVIAHRRIDRHDFAGAARRFLGVHRHWPADAVARIRIVVVVVDGGFDVVVVVIVPIVRIVGQFALPRHWSRNGILLVVILLLLLLLLQTEVADILQKSATMMRPHLNHRCGGSNVGGSGFAFKPRQLRVGIDVIDVDVVVLLHFRHANAHRRRTVAMIVSRRRCRIAVGKHRHGGRAGRGRAEMDVGHRHIDGTMRCRWRWRRRWNCGGDGGGRGGGGVVDVGAGVLADWRRRCVPMVVVL